MGKIPPPHHNVFFLSVLTSSASSSSTSSAQDFGTLRVLMFRANRCRSVSLLPSSSPVASVVTLRFITTGWRRLTASLPVNGSVASSSSYALLGLLRAISRVMMMRMQLSVVHATRVEWCELPNGLMLVVVENARWHSHSDLDDATSNWITNWVPHRHTTEKKPLKYNALLFTLW